MIIVAYYEYCILRESFFVLSEKQIGFEASVALGEKASGIEKDAVFLPCDQLHRPRFFAGVDGCFAALLPVG